MPIYEYQCEACGHDFETLQKISDAPLTTCPACGEDKLKKLISASAFRLKGGGWYETDFKTGNKKNVAQSEKKGDSGGKKEGGSKKADSGGTAAKKTSGGSSST